MPIQRHSASNISRHLSCHASANLPAAIPNWTPPVVDPTAGAKGEGTRIHELLAIAADLTPGQLANLIKAIQYYEDLRRRRTFKKKIEESTTADWLKTKPQTTADVVLYTQDELHIVDWKWGKIPVSPIRNEQLMYYAACWWHLAPKAKGVSLHIVQPSIGNMEEWFCPSTELAKFVQHVQAMETAVQAGDVTFGPSDHCTFCPANPHSRGDKGRPYCPEMMQLLYPDYNIAVDEDAMLNDL